MHQRRHDPNDLIEIVIPEAPLKIYLTATAEVRAGRRAGQVEAQRLASLTDHDAKRLIEKGKSPTMDGLLETIRAQVQTEVEAQIRQRDSQDKSRAIAPLMPALNAIVIDNAAHRPTQTVEAVLALWKLRANDC